MVPQVSIILVLTVTLPLGNNCQKVQKASKIQYTGNDPEIENFGGVESFLVPLRIT